MAGGDKDAIEYRVDLRLEDPPNEITSMEDYDPIMLVRSRGAGTSQRATCAYNALNRGNVLPCNCGAQPETFPAMPEGAT